MAVRYAFQSHDAREMLALWNMDFDRREGLQALSQLCCTFLDLLLHLGCASSIPFVECLTQTQSQGDG